MLAVINANPCGSRVGIVASTLLLIIAGNNKPGLKNMSRIGQEQGEDALIFQREAGVRGSQTRISPWPRLAQAK
jgi:hypothetical protein